MPYVSYPIEKAAQAARIFGAVLLCGGGVLIVFTLWLVDRLRVNQLQVFLVALLLASIIYFLPGVVFFVLGSAIERASRWALIMAMGLVTAVLAALAVRTILATDDALRMVLQVSMDLIIGAPGIYLLVRCWNALPELRFLKRDAGHRRGFAPIMKNPPPHLATPPPPPAMSRRHRPRNGAGTDPPAA